MAHLVQGQGEMVEKVAEDTEQSRERAEAGLAQVQQAAKYQPTCCVM
jgi:t-SNARE complex subunit (syntaxin)